MRFPPVALLVLTLVAVGCAEDGTSAGLGPSTSDPDRAAAASGSEDADLPVPTSPDPSGAVVPTVTAASGPAASVTTPERFVVPRTVAVVGDSLTLSASERIEAALTQAGVEVVLVDAMESRRMVSGSSALPSGVSAIGGLLTADPDLWVVALGTNDVGAGSDRFTDDLRTTLATLPPDAPVVWVGLWIRDLRPEVVAANETLRSEVGRRTAPSTVVDWYSAGAAPGNIIDDGIHLTDEGQQRFAELIAGAVTTLVPA